MKNQKEMTIRIAKYPESMVIDAALRGEKVYLTKAGVAALEEFKRIQEEAAILWTESK